MRKERIMNISQKCNCCVCEPVCKWKEVYQNGIQAILNATIPSDKRNGSQIYWILKDCPHIEVSIKCPHMVTNSYTESAVSQSD